MIFTETTVIFILFFIQFIKVALHLQLLQNVDYIPSVVQYIFLAYLTPSSLYLPLTHPYMACPPPNVNQPLVCCVF